MLLMLALAAASPQPARLDRLIVEWCATNAADAPAACVARQRKGFDRFVKVTGKLYDPQREQASRCLEQSARAPSLDWAAAGNCLNGRLLARNRWGPQTEYGLQGTPDL